MQDYHCSNPSCRRWLFASNATYGRIQITCPNRRCHRAQTVYLGGYRKADMPMGSTNGHADGMGMPEAIPASARA